MDLSEEYVIFQHQLGAALAQWAHIEIAMYSVLSCCVEQKYHLGLGRGLFSIENNRSRMDFADAVMLVSFPNKPQSEEWAALHDRLRAAAKKRNKLAHHIPMAIDLLPEGRRIALHPWNPGAPKRKTPHAVNHPPGSLFIRDITQNLQEFQALRTALTNFAYRLCGLQEPHPKCDEQPGNPKTLREIQDQIRKAVGAPPRPSRRKP